MAITRLSTGPATNPYKQQEGCSDDIVDKNNDVEETNKPIKKELGTIHQRYERKNNLMPCKLQGGEKR